jgi:hypothetical protein
MDPSHRQKGTGKTGGPVTGWVIGHDGSFDAAESWQHVLDAESRSRMDEAEAPPPTAADVAREMINVDGSEGMAAVRAAQVLQDRFEEWDSRDRLSRMQEFQEQVQQEFLVVAAEEEFSDVSYSG